MHSLAPAANKNHWLPDGWHSYQLKDLRYDTATNTIVGQREDGSKVPVEALLVQTTETLVGRPHTVVISRGGDLVRHAPATCPGTPLPVVLANHPDAPVVHHTKNKDSPDACLPVRDRAPYPLTDRTRPPGGRSKSHLKSGYLDGGT